ncbi:MoxR-like ATPase [Lewinella aquimaris]|uniref:MoxR-like ATPase n=1 Tax=Neolewinella aquimaris TaxID=1835722 RepID=A0A840E9K1_9BACT|nr:AAA family ATPase [Neolewinella aquimaris]MBB4078728.1 MoxR-like ATPase [Neolewinella aquimaris]
MTVKRDTDLRLRTESLLDALTAGLYERDHAMGLALLTAVAGESIFLLGPPGVGKSLIARRLKYAFRDGVSFEYLMSKFSTPDEVFGPISIKKLRDEDKYERLTDRYLPGANIVFLDEIWKAGPAIQNALLTILNEKIYRNGEEDMKVNIRGIITASNELPPRSANLAPIWDRFLVRLELSKISQYQNFVKMVVDTQDVYEDNIPTATKLSEEELDRWSIAIDAVEVPAEVLNTLQLLLYKIEQYNARPNHAASQINIYDRRWKKAVRLLRTSAYLHGRKRVDLMDCFLLEHCLWNGPEQREVIREMIVDAVRKHGYSVAVNLSALKKEVREFEDDVREETRIRHVQEEEQLLPVQESYYELEKDLSQFRGVLVTIEQFRGLSNQEFSSVNFYDEDRNLVNRIRGRKGPRENTIEVNFNGTDTIFRLKTHLVERQEVIRKKPHRILQDFWDERHERLSNYIRQQLTAIEAQGPDELDGIQDHLFVDAAYATVVSANLSEVREALAGLLLQLEKLQFEYGGVER